MSQLPATDRQKIYVIVSAVGPPWELLIKGNFQEGRFTVEDQKHGVIGMVSPGEELPFARPASDVYRLRLGAFADSCTVIVALMAIERMEGQRGELSPVFPRSSSHSWPHRLEKPGEFTL